MNRPKLDIIIVVWGGEFTSAFLNATLPSILAPGNLPALAERTAIRLKIFTSTGDADELQAHPLTQQTKKFAKLCIFQIAPDELNKRHKYLLHTSILEAAIGTCREDTADFMILAPDFIVGNGSLCNLYEMLADRRGIAFVPTVRTTKYGFLSDLLNIHGAEVSRAGSLTISNRELARLALRHLHPLVQSALVSRGENGRIFCRPPLFYWPIGEEGLLMRSFVWSPLYVRPNRWPEKLLPTIDFQDFPTACAVAREDIIPATDSDNLMIVEYSSYTADFHQVAKPYATIEGVVDWIGRLGMPHHLKNINYSYLLHATELPGAIVDPIRAESANTAIEMLEGTRPLIKFRLAPNLFDKPRNI